MIDEHREDQAALAALDLLPPAEREEFERACAGDAEVARLREELRRAVDLLPLAVAPVAPKPELRARILMSLPPPPPGPSVIRLAKLAVAPRSGALGFGRWLTAAIALAACIVLTALWRSEKQRNAMIEERLALALAQSKGFAQELQDESGESRQLGAALAAESARAQSLATELRAAQQQKELLSSENEARTQELEAARKKSADLETEVARLRGEFRIANAQVAVLTSLVKTQPGARAVSLWDGEQQRGILIVQGLPALPEDRDYQLWVIDPTQKAPVDAGVFQVSPEGPNQLQFKPKSDVTGGRFAVTIEPKGGAAAPAGSMVLKSN